MLDELMSLLSAPRDALQGVLGTSKDALGALGVDPESWGGKALGFGYDMLTDPLTYALPAAGGLLGRALGRAAGAPLTQAAAVRGPRFGSSFDSLTAMAARAPTPELGADLAQAASRWSGAPRFDAMLQEINPAADIIGSGAEGVALRNPGGGVTRIGGEWQPGVGRPVSPDILQPNRALDILGRTQRPRTWRVEHMPFADDVGTASRDVEAALADRLAAQGISFHDTHAGNIGTHAGRPVVIDPGSVELARGLDGLPSSQFNAAVGNVPLQGGGPGDVPDLGLKGRLLDLFGNDRRMQAAVNAGSAMPDYATTLGRYGLAGGAAGGGSLPALLNLLHGS